MVQKSHALIQASQARLLLQLTLGDKSPVANDCVGEKASRFQGRISRNLGTIFQPTPVCSPGACPTSRDPPLLTAP